MLAWPAGAPVSSCPWRSHRPPSVCPDSVVGVDLRVLDTLQEGTLERGPLGLESQRRWGASGQRPGASASFGPSLARGVCS